MAANYWESTQRKHWQFTKLELVSLRQQLENEDPTLVHAYPLPEIRHLSIFFNDKVTKLAKRLGGSQSPIKQQPIATAQMFLRRFYTKIEIRRTNPYLLIATALYLACKTEECPQHIRIVVSEARALWPDFFATTDTSKLGECEFFLISEMNSQMIIHQPYRSLNALQGEFGLSSEESQLCWSIINDHYMTDLPLLYPPHIIALIAILLVLAPAAAAMTGLAAQSGNVQNVLQSVAQQRTVGNKMMPTARNKIQKFSSWLAASNVDIEAMIDATQEMISFYEVQEQYNEKSTKEQINRFVRARNLDK